MEKEVKLFTEDVMKDMGKRIQDARKKKGYKAIDFADIIGIGKDQLSRIETGRAACKIDYLFVTSQYLEVSCDFLMFGGEDIMVNVQECDDKAAKKKQIIKLLNEL